jgi:hypothetical protein
MNRARFAVQAIGVFALIVLVSWPEQRQVRAATLWRPNGTLTPRRATIDEDRRVRAGQDAGRRAIVGRGPGYHQMSAVTDDALASKLYGDPLNPPRGFVTPTAIADLGGRTNALVGRARTTLNTPIPYARLLLRNMSTGLVDAQATADEEGRFTFLDVDPSAYIVELVDTNGAVLAASGLVPISFGELRETTVRVASARAIGGTFGGSLAPTANEPVAAADNSGVEKVTQPPVCVSPPCR